MVKHLILKNEKYMLMNEDFKTIGIKNMVCNRCITAVEKAFEIHQIDFKNVQLGSAMIARSYSSAAVSDILSNLGFELLTTNEHKVVENVKTLLIKLIDDYHQIGNQNLSTWLSAKTHKDYHYLSHLFSEMEGITIERYFIKLRIEKVKELLVYNELNLKEIAYQLGFSSTAHLSTQFKKELGITTSHFKNLGNTKRKFLDNI